MRNLTVMAVLIIAMMTGYASANIIRVPGDYPTIQDGIDAAAAGDTVMVAANHYYENLTINQQLSLIGEHRDHTIIDGSNTGDVIYIDADLVTVSNFTITGCGDNTVDAGIELAYCDNCEIELCRFTANHVGFDLYFASGNIIRRCIFEENIYGIRFWEDIENPQQINNYLNTIANNVFVNNSEIGIWFEHTLGTHHHSCKIFGNRIMDNNWGISMIMSMLNEIRYNHIENNVHKGIDHMICEGGGGQNVFHHNNFINNNGDSVQASNGGIGNDIWYDASTQEGNHWSNYTGPDDNGDGIGDIPMEIEGYHAEDAYPLMEPLTCGMSGMVVNDAWVPISDVIVTALGTDIVDTTEYHGSFLLSGLKAGNYDISFSHPDYRDTVEIGVAVTLGEVAYSDMTLQSISDINTTPESKPVAFSLDANYPNPFNAATTIAYTLLDENHVTIEIYDLLGRKLTTLVDGIQPAGSYQITWHADNQPSGVYFYKIKAGDYSQSQRMLLLK